MDVKGEKVPHLESTMADLTGFLEFWVCSPKRFSWCLTFSLISGIPVDDPFTFLKKGCAHRKLQPHIHQAADETLGFKEWICFLLVRLSFGCCSLLTFLFNGERGFSW
jgi:hypothetical protein